MLLRLTITRRIIAFMTRYIGSISFLCVFFIAMPIAFGATNSDPACATQSKLVESTIAAVSKSLKGEEYCQFCHYQTFGDVDGDGTDLSGRKWQPITVKTGERGQHDPISAEVRGRKIMLETLVYRPSDAMCCPSGKGSLATRFPEAN